jgi:uncharacterized protein (DUF1778 family)
MQKCLTVKVAQAQLDRIDRAAQRRNLSRSNWVRLALDAVLEPAKGVGWPERLAELQRQAVELHGHPADQMRKLNR